MNLPIVDGGCPQAHVNDLPAEVLEQVFLLCKQNSQFQDPVFCRMNQYFPPMALTQVCRLWRYVSISISSLWSSFTASGNHLLVEEWIRRSRTRPLKVRVQCPAIGPVKYLSPEARLSLLRRADRWTTLSLSAKIDSRFMNEFLALPPEAMHSLETFSIDDIVKVVDLAPYLPRLAAKLHTLPSLKQLSLSVRGCIEPGVLDDMPFERLTHLKLEGHWHANDFGTTLSRCTSAVEVSFETATWTAPAPIQYSILPNLKSLTIKADSIAVASSLLRALTCPSLRRLHVHAGRPTVPSSIQEVLRSFNEFIGQCALDQLIICFQCDEWECSCLFLTLQSIQSIPEVEVRNLRPSSSKGMPRRRYCPRQGCKLPHIGWSTNQSKHLGTPLESVEWATASWNQYHSHETQESDWRVYFSDFQGFVSEGSV